MWLRQRNDVAIVDGVLSPLLHLLIVDEGAVGAAINNLQAIAMTDELAVLPANRDVVANEAAGWASADGHHAL